MDRTGFWVHGLCGQWFPKATKITANIHLRSAYTHCMMAKHVHNWETPRIERGGGSRTKERDDLSRPEPPTSGRWASSVTGMDLLYVQRLTRHKECDLSDVYVAVRDKRGRMGYADDGSAKHQDNQKHLGVIQVGKV